MLWPKKNPCGSKIPLPLPITFLVVRPLSNENADRRGLHE